MATPKELAAKTGTERGSMTAKQWSRHQAAKGITWGAQPTAPAAGGAAPPAAPPKAEETKFYVVKDPKTGRIISFHSERFKPAGFEQLAGKKYTITVSGGTPREQAQAAEAAAKGERYIMPGVSIKSGIPISEQIKYLPKEKLARLTTVYGPMGAAARQVLEEKYPGEKAVVGPMIYEGTVEETGQLQAIRGQAEEQGARVEVTKVEGGKIYYEIHAPRGLKEDEEGKVILEVPTKEAAEKEKIRITAEYEAEKRYKKLSPVEKAALHVHTVLGPKGYEYLGFGGAEVEWGKGGKEGYAPIVSHTPEKIKLPSDLAKQVFAEEIAYKVIHPEEMMIGPIQVRGAIKALQSPVIELETAFLGGAVLGKIATTKIGGKVLASKVGKVVLGGLGVVYLAEKEFETRTLVKAGRKQEAAGRLFVGGAALAAMWAGYKLETSHILSQPKEVVIDVSKVRGVSITAKGRRISVSKGVFEVEEPASLRGLRGGVRGVSRGIGKGKAVTDVTSYVPKQKLGKLSVKAQIDTRFGKVSRVSKRLETLPEYRVETSEGVIDLVTGKKVFLRRFVGRKIGAGYVKETTKVDVGKFTLSKYKGISGEITTRVHDLQIKGIDARAAKFYKLGKGGKLVEIKPGEFFARGELKAFKVQIKGGKMAYVLERVGVRDVSIQRLDWVDISAKVGKGFGKAKPDIRIGFKGEAGAGRGVTRPGVGKPTTPTTKTGVIPEAATKTVLPSPPAPPVTKVAVTGKTGALAELKLITGYTRASPTVFLASAPAVLTLQAAAPRIVRAEREEVEQRRMAVMPRMIIPQLGEQRLETELERVPKITHIQIPDVVEKQDVSLVPAAATAMKTPAIIEPVPTTEIVHIPLEPPPPPPPPGPPLLLPPFFTPVRGRRARIKKLKHGVRWLKHPVPEIEKLLGIKLPKIRKIV